MLKGKWALVAVLCLYLVHANAASDSWVDRITMGGDFRYRHEYIDSEDVDGANHRQRIRARLKTKGRVNNSTDVIVQLTMGNDAGLFSNQWISQLVRIHD